MVTTRASRLLWFAIASLASTNVALGYTKPEVNYGLQPPTLATPDRGSVTGTLANAAFGPTDLARGGAAVPLPLSLPDERGAPLVPVAPTYASESSMGAWGMGWQANLSITRFRHTGDFNDADDVFVSPWGELSPGDDGDWYPAGMRTFARAHFDDDVWTVTLADGTVWTFAEAVAGRGSGYAWFVTEARNIVGERTALTYERNTSGWPFLSSMEYGGVRDTPSTRCH